MAATPASIGKVGFLADTHSMKADGSDLPDRVLRAFDGVDLIVHLGDIGRKAILDRLTEVAPVLVPFGGNKGYLRHATTDAPIKVIDAGAHCVGLTFNLAQPDKKIAVSATGIAFPDEPLATLLKRRFRQPVTVVAFGGTHRGLEQDHEGVLLFNPGSPTLPDSGAKATVAVLDLTRAKPKVKLVPVG